MPIVGLGRPGFDAMKGRHVECDYCTADATWHHWAVAPTPGREGLDVNRDAYACNAHVGLLNRFYGEDAEDRP
jgi:hypothetical protein